MLITRLRLGLLAADREGAGAEGQTSRSARRRKYGEPSTISLERSADDQRLDPVPFASSARASHKNTGARTWHAEPAPPSHGGPLPVGSCPVDDGWRLSSSFFLLPHRRSPGWVRPIAARRQGSEASSCARTQGREMKAHWGSDVTENSVATSRRAQRKRLSPCTGTGTAPAARPRVPRPEYARPSQPGPARFAPAEGARARLRDRRRK